MILVFIHMQNVWYSISSTQPDMMDIANDDLGTISIKFDRNDKEVKVGKEQAFASSILVSQNKVVRITTYSNKVGVSKVRSNSLYLSQKYIMEVKMHITQEYLNKC